MNEQEKYDWMVYVSCMTYNHAPYIVDAMNGFTMQETNFPFVCAVVDDASTDGEQEVIKSYLNEHFDLKDNNIVRHEETDDYILTFARHKTNKNCYFAVFYLKYNHYSIKKRKWPYYAQWRDQAKYIALCEGDDYWIHPKKLQMQVDFLDSHPKHTLCIHAYRRDIFKDNKVMNSTMEYKFDENMEIISDEDVLKGTGMFAATASMMYRLDAVKNYPEWARHAPVGDRPLQLVLFTRGHIGYLKDVMSVYRIGIPGSWTLRILNNEKEEKKSRKRFYQMYRDFDKWTNGRYHYLIQKGLRDLRIKLIKDKIKSFLHKQFLLIKKLFHVIS